MTASEDREIIESVLDGDVDAFEKLVRKYERKVFAIAARHVPGDRVEETAHETFVRAYRSLGNYRFEKPFGHWLSRLAVRACYDFWRKQKRNKEIPAAAFFGEHAEWVQDVLTEQAEKKFSAEKRGRDARELLDWAMSRISAENRAALTLIHLEGYTVKEAAEMLGWSVVNTKVRSHRARLALRKVLEKLSEEAEARHEKTG